MIGDSWWSHPFLWFGAWLVGALAWGLLGRRVVARPVLVLVARHVRSWVPVAAAAIISLVMLWAPLVLGVVLLDESFWLAEAILLLVLAAATLMMPLAIECFPTYTGLARALTEDLRLLGAEPRAAAARRAWVLTLWALGLLTVAMCALLGVVFPLLERIA